LRLLTDCFLHLITGLDSPLGLQEVDDSAHDGGKVRFAHRPPFYPMKYSWYSVLLEVESILGP